MQRIRHPPRPGWRGRMQALGFTFAELGAEAGGEPYWDETAHWRLTAAEVDTLEDATNGLHQMCMQAADHAVRGSRYAALGIPEAVWPLVVRSWERQEGSLYGRMDLRWDGDGPPLLLEYNADTPTALYEAAVVQWDWLCGAFRDAPPGADQFNSIHEALIAAWSGLALPATVHFTALRGGEEDRGTVEYLRDTAVQAGLDAPFLCLEDIGWDGHCFVDLQDRPIAAAFKLYPWEWLLRDRFGAHVAAAGTRWVEPAWRMILSGKGLLALLWEMFPGHPNLLPAYREPGRTGGAELRKPLWGREGANVSAPGWETGGPYGREGWVHQAWKPLPCRDGRYAVIGSWVVAGRACGIGIREDDTPITRDTSRFVPHLFLPGDP